MALRSDRSTLQTDISFFMNEAATRGGCVVLSAGGSGASMDNGAALVTYTPASGTVPMGILLNDMVNIDLTRQHLNQHKDEVQKGGKVTILQKGWVVTNSLDCKTAPVAGDQAHVTRGGLIANSGGNVATDSSATVDQPIGSFLSGIDEDGYAKVYVDLPGTFDRSPRTGI